MATNTGKRILFCGNGMSAEVIPEVKKWGYTVYLLTEFINDRGVEYADKVLFTETKNPEKALQASKLLYYEGYRFDGVMSLCWDCALSVAIIAQEFDLISVSVDTAKKATYKTLRSTAFHECNVPAPKFKIISSFKELEKTAKVFGLPVILKPINLSSCKGVILIEDNSQLKEAYDYTRSFSIDSKMIVNEYLKGSEHSTEGLMINGHFFPTAISDRLFHYDECKPYFVEIGDVMPTILNKSSIRKIFEATEKAALAIGIINGVVKGDLIFCDDHSAKVFEIAARLGGPRFGTEMAPISNGTNILKAAIQQALGEPIDYDCLKPKYEKGMVNRSIFPSPGIIKDIQGLDRINNFPGFYDFKWWTPDPLKVGDRILPYKDMSGNVAYFICSGNTREEALVNANNIEREIKIITKSEIT